MPDKTKSIYDGGIVTMGDDSDGIYFKRLESACKHFNIDLSKPINKLSKKELDIILYGSTELIKFNYSAKSGTIYNNTGLFEGVINNLERRYIETNSDWIREWIDKYMIELPCPTCKGARLKEEVLSVKINGKNIDELTRLNITEIYNFLSDLKLNEEQEQISKLLIKEIKDRLSFLINVGLDYLTLNREASTLSGGESQRIRLATQIGTRLTGVLYVLDEPSIGLHQRDNDKLIDAMLSMRDLGNTLVVVEHDLDTMRRSDFLVDIGPLAGEQGGEVVACGTPEEVASCDNSITGNYLSGKKCIEVPKTRRKGSGKYLEIQGACENNLKNINVKFPLGTFTCVTGVSGSGKSTLVNEILYKKLTSEIYGSKVKPGKFKKIKGLEYVDKVVHILDGTKDSNTNILHNKTSLITDKCLEGQDINNAYSSNHKDVFSIVGNNGQLIELEEGEYELVFDREKIRQLAKDNNISNLANNAWFCALLYNNPDGNGKALFDTGGKQLNKKTGVEPGKQQVDHSFDDNSMSMKFKVDSNSGKYLGINLGLPGGNRTDANNPIWTLGNNYDSYMTLNKIK